MVEIHLNRVFYFSIKVILVKMIIVLCVRKYYRGFDSETLRQQRYSAYCHYSSEVVIHIIIIIIIKLRFSVELFSF